MSLGNEITDTAEKVLHGIEHVGEQLEQGAEHLVSKAAQSVGVDPASILSKDNWDHWDHGRIHAMLQDIDTEQIRAKADDWSSVAGKIRDIFQSLQQDLTNTVQGGWQGSGADAAAQAPAALAAWGNALADSADATGDRMRQAADGVDRTKNQVGPASTMDWNSRLSGVMQQLADPSASAAGGSSAPGSDDASQSFAGNQAGTDAARRAMNTTYTPSMTSADSQVPAFPPPTDPTGGGSGPRPMPVSDAPSSFSGGGGLPSGGPGYHHGSPQPGPADYTDAGTSSVHQRHVSADPISAAPVAITTDPSSAMPYPQPDPGSPVYSSDNSVPSSPGYQNAVPGYPPAAQQPGTYGGGYGSTPAPGGPGAGVPAAPGPNPPRGGGFAGPTPLGGGTTGPVPSSGGTPPVAGRGGAGGGMAAGMMAFGAGGRDRDGKRRKAYGAGLFDDPFTGQQRKDDAAADEPGMDEFPETAAEQTGPIYLDDIRNGFGPQGPDGGAPPVLGGPR